MTGNIHGFATTNVVLPHRLVDRFEDRQPGEDGECADDRDDDDVDVRVDRLVLP